LQWRNGGVVAASSDMGVPLVGDLDKERKGYFESEDPDMRI